MEVIKIAALHLEGEAHEWLFHGLSTLVHASISSYLDFTWRLVERFYPRDAEAQFVGLTKLKQLEYLETYISKFLKLSIMVSNLTMTRRVFMFIDGLVTIAWVGEIH